MGLESIQALLVELVSAEGGTNEILLLLVESIVGIVIVLLVNYFVVLLINQQIDHVGRRHQLRVYSRTVTLIVILLGLVALWLPNGQIFLSVLALFAAALTVTLSRPITNVMAWLVIVTRAPIRVGDRVEIGEVHGDVVDIGILHTHLLELGNWVDAQQSTGRVVHIPNSFIFDGPVFNATDQFNLIWNEMDFYLTVESDWETARDILINLATPLHATIEQAALEAAERMTQRYAYKRGITTPFVYVKLLRDGLKLSLRYLCIPRRRRGTAHDITIGFLSAIRENPRIVLAAPSYRIKTVV